LLLHLSLFHRDSYLLSFLCTLFLTFLTLNFKAEKFRPFELLSERGVAVIECIRLP
jgi:hypothetical protein